MTPRCSALEVSTVVRCALAVGLSFTWSALAVAGSPPDDDEAGDDGGPTAPAESSEPVEGAAPSRGRRAGPLALEKGDDRKDLPWIRRWAPERNTIGLGVFGGIYLPGENHELYRPDPLYPNNGHRQFNRVAPEFGARAGYYPARFFGVEAEGAMMPTRTDNDLSARLWTVRGHAVLQIPRWSVVPFLAAGGGALAVGSNRLAVGNDVDPAVHFGGGVKVYIQRNIGLRLDVRDVVSNRLGTDNPVELSNHNLELTLGLSFTLGRKQGQPKPSREPVAEAADRDRDGIPDADDRCPDLPGDPPTGCPNPDPDGDGLCSPWVAELGLQATFAGVCQGIDQCPDEAEDLDGFQDDDGCPDPDNDGDGLCDPWVAEQGLLDRYAAVCRGTDRCRDEPETVNGFQDDDGCPDELPAEISKFSGVIKGITFDTNKDTIRPTSRKTLDEAAAVLGKYPDLRIKIVGHTDSDGSRDKNLDLSRRRAEAVKRYLVEQGKVDEARISTEGRGPDEPVADNKTKAGKAENRRIEFKLVQ